MRYLPALAVILVAGMTGATIWIMTGSPGVVEEIKPSPAATLTATPVSVMVTVEKGQGVQDIGDMLQEQGVIDSAIQFEVLVELLGYERILQAGEYEFEANTPALEVVYRMRRGIVSALFVTVVEGWRLEEIADAVDDQGAISREDFLEAALARNFDFDFLRRLGPETSLEGYLFPATYFYSRSDSAEDLVQQMLEAMDENFSQELRDDALDQGLTMHSTLTLASIIEREAQLPEERPIIAQVFLKRLRVGIPLEADPTVQYALAQDVEGAAEFGYWKADLTAQDLEVDSPYNTYRFGGLPPAPIAAPRLESIQAVIEPADTNFLYFVARPDGSHAFAETLEEHERNVEEFAR